MGKIRIQRRRKKKIRMRKIRGIILLIISIVIVVFNKVQAQNKSLNKSIYNFLEDEGNQKDVYTAAR